MEYIAIVLGIVGLLMAWRANRKNVELKERIADANSRVYNLRREQAEQQEQSSQELMTLKFEILKLQGDLKVTPDMQIGQILQIHPQTQQILAGFHIGGCSSCAVDDRQSLGEAVAINGRELEPILAALNTLVAEGGNGTVAPERLRTPNVQLQF